MVLYPHTDLTQDNNSSADQRDHYIEFFNREGLDDLFKVLSRVGQTCPMVRIADIAKAIVSGKPGA